MRVESLVSREVSWGLTLDSWEAKAAFRDSALVRSFSDVGVDLIWIDWFNLN